MEKVKTFLLWGIVLLILGFGMDLLGITPIIKRIATSAFTLASGGFALIALALSYWYIDVKDHQKKWMRVFSVVGTNSIFIYLFSETVGHQWFTGFGKIFTEGLLKPLGISEAVILVANALFVLFMFWYLTYFLDKKKVYFKI